MSDQQQASVAFQNGGIQKPMFAPVSQNSKFGEDIDLSDIFSDYFNNMEDPLITSTSTNHSSISGEFKNQDKATIASEMNTVIGSSSIQQPGSSNSSNVTLPTGRGIKTPFHAGHSSNMFSQERKIYQASSQSQDLPPAKKQKHIVLSHQTQQQQQATQNLQEQMSQNQNSQLVSTPLTATETAATGSKTLSKVCHSDSEDQLANSRKDGAEIQENKISNASGGITLPVGVGIRLGSVVPPSTSNRNGITINHTNWGVNPSSASSPTGFASVAGQFGLMAGLGGDSTTRGPGGLSEPAIAERRQRNREHAKRSRVRKKFLLESLQHEVSELQKENERLRMFVQGKIPNHAREIMDTCCQKSPLFVDAVDSDAAKAAGVESNKVELVKSDFSLIESLTSGQQNFVLSDPRLPDNPLVYASEGFYQLTGYTREQVLGRNCRFLQGEGTDPKAVDVIRTAIANGTDATTCILNYKADGTPFWNQFFIAALRDSNNCIVNYVGIQCVVEADSGASALEDKVNSVLPLQHRDDQEIEYTDQ